ncbi:hypothetical protein [Muriicola sp. Z0-33]|uniref:hypothetical protein n=1 Tax=Muriicola sp. Z0-33 TaxID=2816957 RepID=UPI002237CD6B|nr:hypothetical protein [Muriicola sp. Z0-33]MCW5516997.1 hypothetical protein [Muriicola sp. Z0-33]
MLHNRFWQAFFALTPIIVVIIAIAAYMAFFISLMHNAAVAESSGVTSASVILGEVSLFIILIFLAVLLSLASLVFFIVHAVQNPNLKENNLLLVWILLFVFVSGIAQVIYWIIEILNKPRPT